MTESRGRIASRKTTGTHDYRASHRADEIQIAIASHPAFETQKVNASQRPQYLRLLSDSYVEVQEARKRVGNREFAMAQFKGVAPETAKRADHLYSDDLERVERGYLGHMEKYLRGVPVYDEFLSKVRGIGPRISAGVIGIIGNMARFGTVSNLWAYAGYHTVDGVAARHRKGEKANWSADLKQLFWAAGESFVRSGGWYRNYYDGVKPEIAKRHAAGPCKSPTCKPSCALGHIDNMARRATVKMFISHLWAAWRELEGLPTPEPYAVSHLGHKLIHWSEPVGHDASQSLHETHSGIASQYPPPKPMSNVRATRSLKPIELLRAKPPLKPKTLVQTERS